MNWRNEVDKLYKQYDLIQENKNSYKNNVINYGETLLDESKFEQLIKVLDTKDEFSYPERNYGHQAVILYNKQTTEDFRKSYDRVAESFKSIVDYTSIEELTKHYREVKNEPYFKVYDWFKTSNGINAFFNTRLRNAMIDNNTLINYWVGKAPNEKYAMEMIENGYFEIYFSESNVGDMSEYDTIKSVSDNNDWFKNDSGNLKMNDRKALWDIAHEVNSGDVIYLALGTDNILAKGIVVGSYEYIPESKYHQVKVEYDESFKGTVSVKLARKTLTNITGDKEFRSQIENDITNTSEELLNISMYNKFMLKQVIIDGAPGTGKSFNVNKEVENNNIKYERVTFYQDYEYHNFVGSILPVVKEGDISYEFVNGPFTKILNCALSNPEETHYLIIEELTRGNAASIFGDVFQLLDRNNYGFSEYPITNDNIYNSLSAEVQAFLTVHFESKIVLPPNLSIICTINSSDQNVFPLDTAFKRRFDYEIKSTLPSDDFIDFNIQFGDIQVESWKDFYTKLNIFILRDLKLKEDKQVGPYFIKNHEQNEDKLKSIQTKLAMYMWNDLHKVHSISSKAIFDNNKVHTLYDVDRIFREGSKQEITSILTAEFIAHFGIENE